MDLIWGISVQHTCRSQASDPMLEETLQHRTTTQLIRLHDPEQFADRPDTPVSEVVDIVGKMILAFDAETEQVVDDGNEVIAIEHRWFVLVSP